MRMNILAGIVFGFLVSTHVLAEAALPSVSDEIIASAKLEVVEIDQDKRTLKLKNEKGDVKQIEVGSDVRNFDQIKVGDFVDVEYVEAIDIKVFKPDEVEPGAYADAVFGSAKEGEKPAVVAADNVTLVATISAIDVENNTVTLTGKEGNTKTLTPRDPANLAKVKVGDQVMFSYTRVLAIAVVGNE